MKGMEIMKVLDIKDRDDGYCDVEFEFSDDEIRTLLSFAVTEIIKKRLEREEASNE